MSEIESFFEYQGYVGERNNQRAYKYVAYRVPGNSAWFMKGRYMVDFDGAPNCYHPSNAKLLQIRDYPTVDIMAWDGVLDTLADAKNDDGTWASVVLDANGDPIVQGPDEPCPGFLVSTVPLQDDAYPTTSARRYADARIIPYLALPLQILQQQGVLFKMIADRHTGNFGDYVTAVNLNTNDAGQAVIGDTGNKPHFGEGSYAWESRSTFSPARSSRRCSGERRAAVRRLRRDGPGRANADADGLTGFAMLWSSAGMRSEALFELGSPGY